MSDFAIILRSLRLRLFSTTTTVLTVAIAVCLMLVLVSLREASRNAFERGTGNMQLFLSADSSPMVSVLNGIFYANPPLRVLKWPECQDLLKRYPIDFQIPIQQGDSYRGFPILATTPDFFSKFKPDPVAGWNFAEGEPFNSEFQIVAGAAAARALHLKLGDKFHITHGASNFDDRDDDDSPVPDAKYPTFEMVTKQMHRYSKYTVVGILKPTGTSHDRALITDLTSSWIVHMHEIRHLKDPSITTTTAADIADSNKIITGVYIRFKTAPGMSESPVLSSVYDELKRNHPEITVAVPVVEVDRLFTIVSNIDAIFVAMAGIVMISSSIAIMLALYNSMEQRRRQIAVMRVLGCSQVRIMGLIITEAAVIGLIGAVTGLLLSVAAISITAGILDATLGLVIEPHLGVDSTVMVMTAVVLLAGFAGIIPAVMAYRTTVARSLQPIG